MGVLKFRSVADMPGPPARSPLDPENLRIACRLMELARRLSGQSLTPGVRRFRSYDEMLQVRAEHEAEATRPTRAGQERSA